MSTSSPKDMWDKLLALSALLASVFVPIVVVVVANTYTNAMKESENRFRYTEMAIAILRTAPSSNTAALRGWAVDIVNKYSVVPLDAKAKQELLENQFEPYATYDVQPLGPRTYDVQPLGPRTPRGTQHELRGK